MLTWTSILAVLAAIGAFAVAIKALPTIWNALKDVGKFFSGLEKVVELPSYLDEQSDVPETIESIARKVDELAIDLREHMAEEERLRDAEKTMVERLVEIASQQDSMVFRQTAFSSETAYYEMVLVKGVWMFDWCNQAWTDLVGLSLPEAKVVSWLDAIDEAEHDVKAAQVERAREEGAPLDLEVTIVNQKTGYKQLARVMKYPMSDLNGEVHRFLGAIHRLEG